ncbi:MAG: hypothetical protein ACWA5A_17500, partial [Marinibacterium sp.]
QFDTIRRLNEARSPAERLPEAVEALAPAIERGHHIALVAGEDACPLFPDPARQKTAGSEILTWVPFFRPNTSPCWQKREPVHCPMPLTLTRRLWSFCARFFARQAGKESHVLLPAPDAAAMDASRCLHPDLDPTRNLDIPVRDSGTDEHARKEVLDRGRFLARQDRWADLTQAICQAEADRATTPGGMPIADLLALGARTDVVLAAEHALLDGASANTPPLCDGIAALEGLVEEFPNDPTIAMIVAQAHMDIGQAWRGTGWDVTIPAQNRKQFLAHYARAGDLLAPYCGIELSSPSLAAARCALLVADPDPRSRVADDYEDLIDLDPHNHRHMIALGRQLLPNRFGSYDQLDLQARRTAARMHDVWGAGGYSWVWLDVIASDDDACSHVDVDYFIDGLRDIVRKRPDQYMINTLAAYCAVSMRQRTGFDTAADFVRIRIAACARWLIRDHLTEVHPLIWANAVDGVDTSQPITSLHRFVARGRTDAMNAICEQFSDDIQRGNRVRFTDTGPVLLPV